MKQHAAPRAVIWDMDGTLIDSGDYHWRAWDRQMTAEGAPMERAELDAMVTLALGSMATLARKQREALSGIDIDRLR